MANPEGTSHLRLVFSQEQVADQDAACLEQAEQLSFPYAEDFAVILVLVVSMGPRDFKKVIVDSMASWVIDVRVAPRFDTLAFSRDAAFTLFRERRVRYVDLFGRLGISSYRSAETNPAFWGTHFCRLLVKSERAGPYLLLFDDRTLMLSAANVLPPMVRGALGDKVHFRRVAP